MLKEISETGANGTFKGTILIKRRNETIDVHNPSTHDEDKRNVPRWDIKLTVNDKDWLPVNTKLVNDLKSEMEVLNNSAKVENELKDYLGALANNPPVKTLEEKMRERGYN